MQVYHISWASFGCIGLNAVVAANDGEEAVKMLRLNDEPKSIKVTKIGICTHASKPAILAQECA